MNKQHIHTLRPTAKTLQRKEHGFRDEVVYSCQTCPSEFAEIPRMEQQVLRKP